jgi:hypothetical protein
MSYTTKGWFGYREGTNSVDDGMFSYEAAGSFHTPFSDCPEGFESGGIFESDSMCCCRTTKPLIRTARS